jgi:hypothetical protein
VLAVRQNFGEDYTGWTYEFTGANQQAAEALVRQAGEIAGIETRGLRVAYTPNGQFSFVSSFTDGYLTLTINAGTLEFREQATRELVAVHELLHKAHIDRVGYRSARLLAGTRDYELAIERQAYQTLENHYRGLGRQIPEETQRWHELYMRRWTDYQR